VRSLLTWIEQSGLGHLIRESGPWTYPFVNLAHIVGVAMLFGAVVVIDVMLLRGRRTQPWARAAVAAAATPIARTGFVLAAASGLGLVSTNGSEYIGNPIFTIKFPLIGMGLLNAAVVTHSAAWRALLAGDIRRDEERLLASMAAVSLVCWTGAITAGRMIGYW
jgi:hypothetical protein